MPKMKKNLANGMKYDYFMYIMRADNFLYQPDHSCPITYELIKSNDQINKSILLPKQQDFFVGRLNRIETSGDLGMC